MMANNITALTVQDENAPLQDPHPKGIYSHTQQLYLDVKNAWRTTYSTQ